MNVQNFIKTAFKSSLSTFGAETITIAGQDVQAIIDETISSNAAGRGTKDNRRALVVKIPGGLVSGKVRSGDAVKARGEDWHVGADEDSIRHGQAALTITLVEPGRRESQY